MKLHAKYTDGEFYPAEVVAVNTKKKGGKPVKVTFVGYNDSVWMSLDNLKSKKIKQEPATAKATGKAKAKAKAKPAKVFDYSELEKGSRVQAEADGKYYAAEVVTVAKNKAKSAAPVKIHWVGYTAASDEWVGGDRLRSKLLKTVSAAEAGKKTGTIPQAARKFLLVKPKIEAPLDKGFRPLVLGKKKYLEAAKECTDKLDWALIRSDGVARYTLPCFPEKSKDCGASIYLAGVLIQEMLWQRSASELQLCGPARVVKALSKMYAKDGPYEFEALSMPNVCGHADTPFKVSIVEKVEDLPEGKDAPQVCGKDATGCRLAFDLGKSDIKTVAVKDNEVVYSKEEEWDVTNVDPQYHFDKIVAELNKAKATLPKVDAVGGSATGTVSDKNEATWCDIFPNVPTDVYKEKVVDIFVRMAKEVAGDVPLKVINDGEVTALAAYQKIKAGNIMGISMGSSEGGGYCNKDGNLMGWINELCYIKLDLNPNAVTDPWTKGAHRGISHMYLGQRGATKLAAKGGVEVPAEQKYPHKEMCTIKHENHAQCLKLIQEAMKDPEKEPKVKQIYETVGVYLGYALAQYTEFYSIDHVMILGRVSKGAGGDLMLETAKKVLEEEFPEIPKITFHTADDHFKAVGQCIAAAALPELKK
jgi:predicted NBD/HSP70 family sugar kinase